jgi:hypothetical protein
VFRAYQIIVAHVATIWMLAAINGGTVFFVAISNALLLMSVLADDVTSARA